MNAQKLETLPPPPGVIGSLRTGFEVVSSHVLLILMPLSLDLFLWLGPRVSVNKLLNPAFALLFEQMRASLPTAQDAVRVDEAQKLVKNLRYPIMVKHPKSYGSTGMFRESRVDTPEQLTKQVERVCAEFGAARMEEFIVGREYNVLVMDNPDDLEHPIAYPPAELIFPPGEEFWHTDVKWDYNVPFDFKEVTDPELIARLHDIAIRMYKAMDGVSCGRCDIRMNDRGELFILEINPNPAIMLKPEEYGPADYMILYDEGGYKTFFDRLIKVALMRHEMKAGEK